MKPHSNNNIVFLLVQIISKPFMTILEFIHDWLVWNQNEIYTSRNRRFLWMTMITFHECTIMTMRNFFSLIGRRQKIYMYITHNLLPEVLLGHSYFSFVFYLLIKIIKDYVCLIHRKTLILHCLALCYKTSIPLYKYICTCVIVFVYPM